MTQKTKTHPHSALDGWRIFGSTLFATLAIISLLGYLLTRWTHNYLLNTEKFTNIASQLPKKPEVVAALSKFSTQKLFEAINAQALIADSLPDKAKFLAAPLATQLQTTATSLATNIISSEQFETAWLFIVGNAHAEFIKVVTAPPLEVTNDQISNVGLQLGDVIRNVAGQLGREDIGMAADQTIGNATEVTINLRSQIDLIRQAVAAVNYLYAILPLVALTLALAAIWLSHHMSRAILAMSIAGLLVVGLVMVALKAAKSEFVMRLQDATYQSALAVSWDVITEGLVRMFVVSAVILFATMLLAILFGPYEFAGKLRKLMYLEKIGHTRFGETFEKSRTFVKKYILVACVGAAAVAIAVLLIVQQITWVTVIQTLLAWISFCILLAIYVKRPD
ncbi:MAG TPA: hypothetical protein VLA77_01130 [Candidatus Saccharimonadales bacterium]|nr:hypothetical protein [Candidatus Saccharimonadales bacterium]